MANELAGKDADILVGGAVVGNLQNWVFTGARPSIPLVHNDSSGTRLVLPGIFAGSFTAETFTADSTVHKNAYNSVINGTTATFVFRLTTSTSANLISGGGVITQFTWGGPTDGAVASNIAGDCDGAITFTS